VYAEQGLREVNNFNLIRDDVFCPEASKWNCNEIFECSEREGGGGGGGHAQERVRAGANSNDAAGLAVAYCLFKSVCLR
jgi:hypothetical protein